MPDQPYQPALDAIAARAGVATLDEAEARALLAFARAVAETSDDRRAAPLACYLAGRASAGEPDVDARMRALDDLLRALAPRER